MKLQWLVFFKCCFPVQRFLHKHLHDLLEFFIIQSQVRIVIVEFLGDLNTLFIYNSILQAIACNSVSICHIRTVLQVTNGACPNGEKYTGTRTHQNVLIQVVIGDVPPRHDKVRRGKETVHSCTQARTSSPARTTVVSCPPTLQSNHRDKLTWERVHSVVLAESKAQASRSLWLHTFIRYLTGQQKYGIICRRPYFKNID